MKANSSSTARKTAQDAEPSSAQQVLDLPELLELILLEDAVDVKTLLFAQRVSKTFQATAQGSVKLLRKLWLLADTSEKDLEVNKLLTTTTWGRKTRSPPDLPPSIGHKHEAHSAIAS